MQTKWFHQKDEAVEEVAGLRGYVEMVPVEAYQAELDRVIGEAVWALGQLHFYLPKQLDTEASKVQSRITEILDSPEVRDYLERQKEAT